MTDVADVTTKYSARAEYTRRSGTYNCDSSVDRIADENCAFAQAPFTRDLNIVTTDGWLVRRLVCSKCLDPFCPSRAPSLTKPRSLDLNSFGAPELSI